MQPATRCASSLIPAFRPPMSLPSVVCSFRTHTSSSEGDEAHLLAADIGCSVPSSRRRFQTTFVAVDQSSRSPQRRWPPRDGRRFARACGFKQMFTEGLSGLAKAGIGCACSAGVHVESVGGRPAALRAHGSRTRTRPARTSPSSASPGQAPSSGGPGQCASCAVAVG